MKKILLSLGTIGAIAAPIGAVVSCGDKKDDLAGQYLNLISSDIKVKKADKVTAYNEVKKLTTKDAKINEGDPSYKALQTIFDSAIDHDKLMEFAKAAQKASADKSDMSETYTILKGFANDSIKVKVELKSASLGNASKELTITFTA